MNSLKGTCFDLDAYVPVMNLEGYGKKPSNQPATPGDPMSSEDPKVRMQHSAKIVVAAPAKVKHITKARI